MCAANLKKSSEQNEHQPSQYEMRKEDDEQDLGDLPGNEALIFFNDALKIINNYPSQYVAEMNMIQDMVDAMK